MCIYTQKDTGNRQDKKHKNEGRQSFISLCTYLVIIRFTWLLRRSPIWVAEYPFVKKYLQVKSEVTAALITEQELLDPQQVTVSK